MTDSKSDRCRVIFIIVNWNRKNLTHLCLLSLEKYLSSHFEVIVVDNASSDGSVEFLRERHPETVCLENPENLGFSRACNLGLEYIKRKGLSSNYITFLNNDTHLEDDSFLNLLDHMDTHPDVAAAIPGILHGAGVYQTGIGGYELTLKSAFNYFFFLSLLFPKSCKGLFLHQKYFIRTKQVVDVDWISGVCLTLRRTIADTIKGFPEDFFMYAEDVALCRELRPFGKIRFYPLSRVIHNTQDHLSKARPTLWLDSLFAYYDSIIPRTGRKLRCLGLQWIFSLGFICRLLLYLPRFRSKGQKIRDLSLYSRHVFKIRCPKSLP